jgi:hypothetical protein
VLFVVHIETKHRNQQHSGPRNSSFAPATLRPDGFVGVTGNGTVRTRPLRCTGAKLLITADVALLGSVRVGVAGAKGLAPSDAVPVTADTSDHVVSFSTKETLAGLVGTDVTLELELDQAAVFIVGFVA